MQHGLAVKTDNGNAGFADMLIGEKRFNRLGMHAGHEGFRLGEHARPFVAVGQFGALGQRLPQQALLGLVIGPVAGRPEGDDTLAIGLDQRHIDAVERGPAHQPDCLDRPQCLPLHLFAGPVTPPPQATDKPSAEPIHERL